MPCGKKRGRLLRTLILGLLLLTAGIILLGQNLSQTLLDMSYAQAYSIAVETVNRAVRECVGEGLDYGSLVETTLDPEGRVTLLRTRAGTMNRLASETALKAKEELNSLENQNVSVPVGSALGIKFLAGTGPRIRMRIIPIGAVSTGFESTFESAGINQTRHKIFLTLRATVSLILPNGSQRVEVRNTFPLAESIIVGQVPDSFVDVNNQEDMLNLLP